MDETAISRHVSGLDIGAPERPALSLKGRWRTDSGAEAETALCQTEQGVWLLAVVSASDVQAIPLHGRNDLRYERRLRADRIHLGGQTVDVPIRSGGAAKTAIGIGRLRAARPSGAKAEVPAGRYFGQLSAVERAWIDSFIEPDEVLLAWLESATEVTISPSPLGDAKAHRRLLLSDRRLQLVAVSELGDVRVVALDPVALHVAEGGLRDSVTSGDHEWTTALGGASEYREIASVPALGATERLREMARLNHLLGGKVEGAAEARRLLRIIAERGDDNVFDALSQVLMPIAAAGASVEDPAVFGEAVQTAVNLLTDIPQTGEMAEELVSWYLTWEIPAPIGRAILHGVLATADGQECLTWWLELHHAVRKTAAGEQYDDNFRAAADLEMAAHLLSVGKNVEAADAVASCLAVLPSEQVEDILPASGEDLAAGEGGQLMRIRALDLLALAEEEDGQPSPKVVAELARLQPLVASRIEALTGLAETDLAGRARQVLDVYEPGGLSKASDAARHKSLSPLGSDELQVLQHPATRRGGAFGWLTRAVAKPATPDTGQLRAYAERVNDARYPDVTSAIADAAMALGCRTPPAYLSRGERAVGIHAFDKEPPFLLIGSEHLDSESVYYLDPGALRFALAGEVAHLRFQHKRVTTDEVWSGIWDKTVGGVTVAAGFTSLALAMPWIGEAIRNSVNAREAYSAVRQVVPLRVLKAVTGESDGRKVITALSVDPGGSLGHGMSLLTQHTTQAQGLVRRVLPRQAESLDANTVAAEQGQYIAACRAMQLTADRAGLLLCGDLCAAVRAMFVSEREYRPEFDTAVRHGLPATLSRRDEAGALLLQGLAVRVAALVSFYLSDDFRTLRDKEAPAGQPPTP